MDQGRIASAIFLYILLIPAGVTSLECFLWQRNISEKQYGRHLMMEGWVLYKALANTTNGVFL
jgi:hypothetical protein